ncbi:MAG: RDD family protein [Ignavibacteriales bacterium]
MESQVGKICPYCQSAIAEGSEINVCPSCSIPHHKECWMENRGCTTFGCRYAPVVTNIPLQTTATAQNRARTIRPSGTEDVVMCPYCGDVTSSTKYRCQHCQGMLYAGFWNRAWALVVDKFIFLILSYIGLIFFILLSAIPMAIFGGGKGSDDTIGYVALAAFGFMIIIRWLYYAFFESSSLQATPGKLVMGLAVTDLEGRRISFWRSSGRFFASVISIILLLIGYLTAAFTPKKQALHDIIARTVVVRSVRPDQQGHDELAVRRLVLGIIMGALLFVFLLAPLFMFNMLGKSLYYGTKGDEALEDYKYSAAAANYSKAIEAKDFMSWTFYAKRAECYQNLEQYDKAILDYNNALKSNDSDSDYVLNRGICYREVGNNAKAMKDISAYIKENPTEAQGYYERSLVYASDTLFAAEKSDLGKAIQIDPLYYDALNARAELYMDEANYRAALDDFTACTDSDEAYASDWQGCAKAHMALGQLQVALDDLKEAIALDPEDPENYVVQANCYILMKNRKEAINSYTKALAIDPQHNIAKSGLAALQY